MLSINCSTLRLAIAAAASIAEEDPTIQTPIFQVPETNSFEVRPTRVPHSSQLILSGTAHIMRLNLEPWQLIVIHEILPLTALETPPHASIS